MRTLINYRTEKGLLDFSVGHKNYISSRAILIIIKVCLCFALSSQAHSDSAVPDPNEPMQFYYGCSGNALESCYITGIGLITSRTADEFASSEFAKGGYAGTTVYLDSNGGSLLGGLRLGRIIRDAGLNTAVGNWFLQSKYDEHPPEAFDENGALIDPQEWQDKHPTYAYYNPKPLCVSACAYAFLGGNLRFFRDDTKLGFHQFYLIGEELTGEKSQSLAATTLAYVLEMGVDPRIFVSASIVPRDRMYYVTKEEAISTAITPPPPFSNIEIEPYKNGIIAYSKRQIPLEPYDTSMQITFYCRGRGEPFVMLTAQAPQSRPAKIDSPYVKGIWSDSPGTITVDGREIQLPKHSVYQRFSPGVLFYEISLNDEWKLALTGAEKLHVQVHRSRAEGWSVRTSLTLDEMQRKSLGAAFRFCID